MKRLRNVCSIGAAALLLVARGVVAAEAPPDQQLNRAGVEFFEAKVRPVLVERCYECHSSSAKKLKANLKLDSRETMLKGGESEMPAIVPGNLEDSTLIRAIRYEDEGLQMPPKKKLPPEQIADIEAWVKMGAPVPARPVVAEVNPPATGPASHPSAMTVEEGRRFWSFIKPREPATSQPSVDRFILAKLQEKNLKPAPSADKRTLIRRATYDLTGLPPTPAEVDAFEADASPAAFENVIDRLLASSAYGERWARYWLDIAR
jgi:mono/diheme cytochrome c family protein